MSNAVPSVRLDRDRAAFRSLLADRSEPIVARLAATIDSDVSPLAAYAAVSEQPYSFLLESAEKTASSDPDGAFGSGSNPSRHARYSFVGYDPDAIVSVWPEETSFEPLGPAGEFVADWLSVADHTDTSAGSGDRDVLDRLRETLPALEQRGFPDTDRQQLSGGLVGYLAYEAVYDLYLEEVGRTRPDSPLPDAEFALTTKTLVFDDVADTTELVFTPIVRPDEDPDAVYDSIEAELDRVTKRLAAASEPEPGGFTRTDEVAGEQSVYEDAVRTAKTHVRDGDIYQGVISRTRELTGEIDPIGLYDALRAINPSPYMYLISHDDLSIVGASPETLVSVQGDRIVSNPIAGTSPRGGSPVEDRRLAGEMLADDKERAEHTMLVDLARNDVRRVSNPGSVEVEEFMNVLKYSHVQHIESTVTGTLADDVDAFDAARVTFPAGTLTGAPKIRAMEIIDDLEVRPRGVYGGGVGYFSWSGDADFAIVIRTATIDHGRDALGATSASVDDIDRITVQAGAGIVADSDPTSEYEETEQKMNGVLAALAAIDADSEPEAARSVEGDR